LALQNFAGFWRKKCGAKIAALTGSNGKTTTKEFAAQIVSKNLKSQSTRGNLNNHIGLPLSLLQLDPLDKVGIFELGMNHLGEIAELTQIADPDIVLVTCVGRAHLEGVGDIEGIAKAKSEIYTSCRDETIPILNKDDKFYPFFKDLLGGKRECLEFSTSHSDSDVFLKEVRAGVDFIEVSGQIGGEPGATRVEVFGRHNIQNLMAASTLALAVGLEPKDIWSQLSECRTTWGRNQILDGEHVGRLLFDGYNANPDSFKVLFSNLARLSVQGKMWGVFGDMLELGERSGDLHREVGKRAAQVGFQGIWYIGEMGEDFGEGLRSGGFSRTFNIARKVTPDIIQSVQGVLKREDILIVKASRGVGLEEVVRGLGVSL
jgi:UDP-N-acetylmuramoyl-tripeptide--D-alanyl-D-alanine ligase